MGRGSNFFYLAYHYLSYVITYWFRKSFMKDQSFYVRLRDRQWYIIKILWVCQSWKKPYARFSLLTLGCWQADGVMVKEETIYSGQEDFKWLKLWQCNYNFWKFSVIHEWLLSLGWRNDLVWSGNCLNAVMYFSDMHSLFGNLCESDSQLQTLIILCILFLCD